MSNLKIVASITPANTLRLRVYLNRAIGAIDGEPVPGIILTTGYKSAEQMVAHVLGAIMIPLIIGLEHAAQFPTVYNDTVEIKCDTEEGATALRGVFRRRGVTAAVAAALAVALGSLQP